MIYILFNTYGMFNASPEAPGSQALSHALDGWRLYIGSLLTHLKHTVS